MTATDGDKDRPHNIVYFLTGQGVDADQPDQSKFDINRTSGEIFVLKVTDLFDLLCFVKIWNFTSGIRTQSRLKIMPELMRIISCSKFGDNCLKSARSVPPYIFLNPLS